MDVMQRDTMAGPIIHEATKLLQATVAADNEDHERRDDT